MLIPPQGRRGTPARVYAAWMVVRLLSCVSASLRALPEDTPAPPRLPQKSPTITHPNPCDSACPQARKVLGAMGGLTSKTGF